MSNERTERLIVDLAAGLAPVRRLPAVSTRMAGWLVLAAGVVAAAVWMIGPRPDLSTAIATAALRWSLVMPLAAAMIAAASALRLSVPGTDRSPWIRWLSIGVMALWAAALPLVPHANPSSFNAIDDPVHAVCVLRVIAISLLPLVMLTRGVWRGYALDGAWAGALAALGGGAIGALAVALLCPVDQPAHVLVSHVAPIGVLMVAGAALRKTSAFQRG